MQSLRAWSSKLIKEAQRMMLQKLVLSLWWGLKIEACSMCIAMSWQSLTQPDNPIQTQPEVTESNPNPNQTEPVHPELDPISPICHII